MKSLTMIAGLCVVASVVTASPPQIPDTPAVVDELVYARAFAVEEGFKFLWRKERPNVEQGMLLVLKVDKALAVPRAAPMPVLYVGEHTVQRINNGDQSGYLVVVVPGQVDLVKTPIWFGTPDLPERVDSAKVQAERALADEAGIKPFSEKQVQAALAKGGEQVEAADMSALLRDQVAELILEYCPDEKHLAEGFRLPVLTREKQKQAAEDED